MHTHRPDGRCCARSRQPQRTGGGRSGRSRGQTSPVKSRALGRLAAGACDGLVPEGSWPPPRRFQHAGGEAPGRGPLASGLASSAVTTPAVQRGYPDSRSQSAMTAARPMPTRNGRPKSNLPSPAGPSGNGRLELSSASPGRAASLPVPAGRGVRKHRRGDIRPRPRHGARRCISAVHLIASSRPCPALPDASEADERQAGRGAAGGSGRGHPAALARPAPRRFRARPERQKNGGRRRAWAVPASSVAADPCLCQSGYRTMSSGARAARRIADVPPGERG
jgi:hypothetical protein